MGGETKKVTTPFDDLTYRITGCAMAVHRELGPGLREDSYQRALGAALAEAGLGFEAQKLYSVYSGPDEQNLVGYYIPDFVVEERVVVEIKALRGLDNSPNLNTCAASDPCNPCNPCKKSVVSFSSSRR